MRLFLFICCALFLNVGVAQNEKISAFKSEVWIDHSGELTVKETINVFSYGDQIKRGIYRSFPTRYTGDYGQVVEVSFDVENVTRNNHPEPHFTKSIVNGEVLYIGEKDKELKKGFHSYTITYKTKGQIGFFEGYDELYWNVNGLDWGFNIDTLIATVHLPGTVIVQHVGYSGYKGESNKDFITTITNDSTIHWESTRSYNPYEGLTIAVAWPKNLVVQPSKLEREINRSRYLIIALVSLVLVLIYYIIVWKKIGVDPLKGPIVPLFESPNNLPPSQIGYVLDLGFSNKLFSAEIIKLAVDGAIEIKKSNKVFSLIKIKQFDHNSLEEYQQKLINVFFEKSSVLVLTNKNHRIIQSALTDITYFSERPNYSNLFKTNGGWTFYGVVAILSGLSAILYNNVESNFFVFFVSIWFVICHLLLAIFYKNLMTKQPVFKTLFSSLLFTGSLIIIIFFSAPFVWKEALLIAIAGLIINVVFSYLLIAPSEKGRKLMDEIEGFKMFLEIGESSRLEVLHPPEMSLEIFEKYLPYALALGVENKWSEKFENYVKSSSIPAENNRLRWYSGGVLVGFDAKSFTDDIGHSFESATSSASQAPGSSSGSGGGGSSGGGGGGGGGGGW